MKRALIATLLLAGCEQPRTELMIGVVTDIRAPNVIDGAQLIVTRAKDGFVEQQVSWQISGLPNQPFNLPGSYGIYSDGEEVKLDVVLTGLKGENPVVSRRAVLNLVEGKTLFFRMGMTAGCVAKEDCLDTQSCVEGVCRDVNVNPLQLPDYTPTIVGELTCNSGPTYIDTSTGAPLPLSADADQCPVGLCIEGTCLKPPPPETGTRTVTGTQFTTYIQPSGTVNVPADLSTMNPRAIVPDDAGNYTVIPGRGAADGTFVIDNVPKGSYYLNVGTTYHVTNASAFDLTSARIGRANAVAPAQPTTFDVTSVTGLAAWEPGDEVEAFAVQADSWWFGLQDVSPVTTGATALTNFTFTTQDANGSTRGNLLAGEPLVLMQLEGKQTPEGVFYRSATKLFQSSPLTQTDGGVTTVSGAFTDVPQTQMLSAGFPASAWDAAMGFDGAFLRALHPEAKLITGLENHGLSVLGQAGGSLYGQVGATADYLFAPIPHGPDVTLSNMTYGTPALPGLWSTIVHIRTGGFVPVLLPGAMTPARLNVGLSQSQLLATSTSAGAFAPAMGPVRAPTINGLDLFAAQSEKVTTTPTLAWQPPAIGRPSQYRVRIVRLSVGGADGMTTVATTVANLLTAAPSVVVPPGVLTIGDAYALTITATTTPNPDAPFRQRFPEAFSTIASSIFVPIADSGMGGGTPAPPDGGTTGGGGDSGGGSMTAVTQVACTGNHVATITATDGTNAYMPGNVFINIGDVVLIQMPSMHTVTPVGFPGFVGPGQTNCYQFHAPGPYDFKCGTAGHPEMGVINVNP